MGVTFAGRAIAGDIPYRRSLDGSSTAFADDGRNMTSGACRSSTDGSRLHEAAIQMTAKIMNGQRGQRWLQLHGFTS